MANIKDRPYIGTWSLEGRKLVQHTPDALVYINGSLALPGCRSCDGKIDLQRFITEVSVESGVDPNGCSASFTLSVPIHSSESFARDAKFLLHPGLEVHIYERGYFPVKGLYSNLAEPLTDATVSSITPKPNEKAQKDKTAGHKHDDHDHEPPAKAKDGEKKVHIGPGFQKRKRNGAPVMIIIHESGSGLDGTERTLLNNDTGVHYAVTSKGTYQYGDPQSDVFFHTPKGFNEKSIGIEFVHRYHGNDESIKAPWYDKGKYNIPSNQKLEQLWKTVVYVAGQNNIPITFGNVSGNTFSFAPAGGAGGGINTHRGTSGNHSDGTFPQLYMALRERGWSPTEAYQLAREIATTKATSASAKVDLPVKGMAQNPGSPFAAGKSEFDKRAPEGDFAVSKLSERTAKRLGLWTGSGGGGGGGGSDPDGLDGDILSVANKETLTQLEAKVSSSLLERFGLQGLGIEDVAAYPYYHTFHGVVIQVSHSWSGGMQTITVQCASMLHFWQFHKINTQSSIATGNKLKSAGNERSIEGHNFTKYHPYQIIYKLHQMTLGSQNSVTGSFGYVTNNRAVDPGTGRSMFSLMTEYWDRRFNGQVVGLRMHGVSGSLFSTLQAAYLGNQNSAALARKITRSFSKKGLDNKALAFETLNLSSDRYLRSFFFSQSPLNGGRGHSRAPRVQSPKNSSGRFALNLSEIYAFHKAVSNYANFGLFEGVYQSKLDIAQKVMELTGFEFYQDVDGDFVFKPPMWNLDTSSSRVYRIEDIDIINLSFDEKEPQATYCIVKQSQFVASGTEVGVSGDMGRMAQYVDWRLVAKFGYRPFQFETTYLPDTQSMYYMAVARMDVINAPVNSASVTIPLRPEIRPGYPVYIPYLDAFYYIQSMSHSFSVGGQCTTTLQLVSKRAKFFAPGRTDKSGIDAIDLSDGTLPQRPLEVQNNDGVPRLSGFPNVVMALDPNRTNPLEWPTGASLTKVNTVKDLRRLLKMATRSGMGLVADNKDGTYGLKIALGYNDDGTAIVKDVLFYFDDDAKSKPAAKKAIQQFKKSSPDGAIVEAKEALKSYQQFNKDNKNVGKTLDQIVASNIKDFDERQTAINKELEALNKKGSGLTTAQKARKDELEKDKDFILRQRDLWKAAKSPADQALLEGYSDGVAVIFRFMEQLQDHFWSSQDAQTFEELTTHHLAQILTNRKVHFAHGVTGAYRYYSASHPDPKEQGFGLLTFRTPDDGGMELDETPLMLDDDYQDITVQGYVRSPAAMPGTYSAEARLEETRPVRGILIDAPVRQAETPKGTKALGKVLPTSEILTVAFGTFMTEAPKHATVTRKLRKGVGLGTASLTGLSRALSPKTVGSEPTGESTGETYYLNEWDEMWAKLWSGAVLATRKMGILDNTKDFKHPVPGWDSSFPSSVTVGKTKVSLTEPFSTYLQPKGKDKRFRDALSFGTALGVALAKNFQKRLSEGFVELGKLQDAAIRESKLTQELADQYGVVLVDAAASALGVPLGMGSESKQYVVGAKHKTPQWTPVFPVSDANGYEVVGSFQYGRGLNIEPGGVWDSLRSQDPLSVLDTKTVNDLITGLLHGKAVTVEIEKVLPGGRIVKEKQTLKGPAARGALERNVLKTLRKNYSDQQLLDLGLLVKNKQNPDKLDFNMMNWISGQNEAVHKLPVINAAFSLADLSLQQEGRICDCRAAEANIKLEAYGAEGFLQFSPGGSGGITGSGTGENDRATEWMQREALRASVPHKVQQDTMRGTALEKPSGGLKGVIKSFQDPANALTQNAVSAKERLRIFEEQAKAQANRSFSNVSDAFGGDEEG
jgi:hypothetical protein